MKTLSHASQLLGNLGTESYRAPEISGEAPQAASAHRAVDLSCLSSHTGQDRVLHNPSRSDSLTSPLSTSPRICLLGPSMMITDLVKAKEQQIKDFVPAFKELM